MTRNTFEIIERNSSIQPPKYPPVTPIMIATSVVNRPQVKPISTDNRVPSTSWRKMSCPMVVVPNQCCGEGGRLPNGVDVFGSPGRRSGPMSATTMKNARIPKPRRIAPDRGSESPKNPDFFLGRISEELVG